MTKQKLLTKTALALKGNSQSDCVTLPQQSASIIGEQCLMAGKRSEVWAPRSSLIARGSAEIRSVQGLYKFSVFQKTPYDGSFKFVDFAPLFLRQTLCCIIVLLSGWLSTCRPDTINNHYPLEEASRRLSQVFTFDPAVPEMHIRAIPLRAHLTTPVAMMVIAIPHQTTSSLTSPISNRSCVSCGGEGARELLHHSRHDSLLSCWCAFNFPANGVDGLVFSLH